MDTLEGPFPKQGIIIIAPVIDYDGPRIEMKLMSHLDVRDISLGDDGKRREITIVIQKEVELDGSFGPTKLGPIKHFQAQIDGGRIHTDQFVFKPEPFLPNDLDMAPFKESKEYLLIKFPGTMFIGISQGGMTGSSDAQVFELAFATPKTPGNLPEGIGAAQLTKQHGDKLTPAGKSFGMTFSMGFFHHVLELDSWKKL
jgi:hypothetical protein